MLRLHTNIQSSPSLGNLQGYREVILIPWVVLKKVLLSLYVCMMYVWAQHAMAHVSISSLLPPLCEFQGLDSIKQACIVSTLLNEPHCCPSSPVTKNKQTNPPPQKKTWGWRWLSLPPQLRALTSIPSTQIKWFSTTYKSSFGRPDTLSGLLRYQHTHGTHTHICIMTPSWPS